VSRLDTRIEELERRLGGCAACRPTIELVEADRPRSKAAVVDCPGCGEPQEQITVLVAFDPGAAP
jgi:hypothetical protein